MEGMGQNGPPSPYYMPQASTSSDPLHKISAPVSEGGRHGRKETVAQTFEVHVRVSQLVTFLAGKEDGH